MNMRERIYRMYRVWQHLDRCQSTCPKKQAHTWLKVDHVWTMKGYMAKWVNTWCHRTRDSKLYLWRGAKSSFSFCSFVSSAAFRFLNSSFCSDDMEWNIRLREEVHRLNQFGATEFMHWHVATHLPMNQPPLIVTLIGCKSTGLESIKFTTKVTLLA